MNEEAVKRLKKDIYMTKYCRINAYKRTKSWDSFLQCVLFVSNIGVIAGSILSLINKSIEAYSYAILIASIITFALSLFISTKNFYSQSCEFKRTFNELERLEKLANDDNPNYELIRKQYDEVIRFSSNHEQQDLYRLKVEYFGNDIVTGNDILEGKDKKYWDKLYKKELAKDVLIKIGISLGIYLVFIFFSFIISLIIKPFKRNEKGASK